VAFSRQVTLAIFLFLQYFSRPSVYMGGWKKCLSPRCQEEFDYAVERTSLRKVAHTALDALASRVLVAGSVIYLIQPQAVAAMLRGLGFRQIVDLAQSVSGGHLVSAVVSRPGGSSEGVEGGNEINGLKH
jgi:hypothetical protein